MILSNFVHISWLVVKYYGQLKKSLTHKSNLSRFKGHYLSITALMQRVIVETNVVVFLLKTIVSYNSGKIKMEKTRIAIIMAFKTLSVSDLNAEL